MKSITPVLTALAAASAIAAEPPAAPALANWPQWRGPQATGAAPRANPPVSWSESKNVKWKVKLPGFGTGTPIVWGEKIFILSAVPGEDAGGPAAAAPAEPPRAESAGGEGRPGGRQRGGGGLRSEKPTRKHQFVVLCLNRKDGKIEWQKTARDELPHEGHHRDHGFASGSPITDGRHLFAYFGSRGLYCYDLDGSLKWETDLGDMQSRNGFGEGTSPALHGNHLVVNWDHEGEDFVVGLDARTGKEVWRQRRDEPTTWSTPLIVEHAGKLQAVISASNRIRSYDLSSGRPLWHVGGMTANVIPSPVADFGMIYATSGFRGSALLAIKLGHEGDLTDSPAIAWKHDKRTPYVPSPLLYGERLYFYSGNDGLLSCFNAKSGQLLIEAERVPELGGVYASPVGAGGKVFLLGRDGRAVVIKDADKLEVLAQNRLDDRFDASPAVAGNQLFLRGHQHLYCIAE